MRGPWGLWGREEEGEWRVQKRHDWGGLENGIPWGAGSQKGWLEEVEKQSPWDSEIMQGMRENWIDPGRTSSPSVEKGPWEASGVCTQWGTQEPVWAKGPSLGVGCVGALSSLWAPWSCCRASLCRGVQGLWQAGPPGTPLTRRDCRKVQGLLSSGCFEPPLVALAGSPPGAQHTHRGLPARQAPTLQINS